LLLNFIILQCGFGKYLVYGQSTLYTVRYGRSMSLVGIVAVEVYNEW